MGRLRLQKQWSQAELAQRAGIGKRTLERIASGGSAQMSSVIKLWRALDLLDDLDQIIPDQIASPMAQLQQQRKASKNVVRRVSRMGPSPEQGAVSESTPDSEWRWDE